MNIHYMNILSELDISLLGFLSEKPMHGYELHRKVSDFSGYGIVWKLKIGKLYNMLNKLNDTGLVSVENYQEGNRPIRNEFSITKEGRKVFHNWLDQPVLHGREFRNFFMLKLFFSMKKSNKEALRLIEKQIEECVNWKTKLVQTENDNQESPESLKFHVVVNNYRIKQIEADIEWLNWCMKEFSEEI